MMSMPDGWPPALRTLCDLLAGKPVEAGRLEPEGWQALADLAIHRHRVAPVIAEVLGAAGCPADQGALIRGETMRNARGSLHQMAEFRRLKARFADLGVDPVVLKGWSLAEQLYGGAGKRHSRDLDLFIGERSILDCCTAMTALGYRPDPDHVLRARIIGSAAIREECNDMAFVHAGNGLQVELHWRAHHFRGWPELMATPGATHETTLAGIKVRVPTRTTNLIYLSVHGSMHLWGRLKWLADIARLVQGRGADDLDGDLDHARSVDAWMPVALGLRLSAALFGSPLPGSLEQVPGPLMRIERQVLAGIADPNEAPSTLRYRLNFYRTALALSGSRAQALGVLRYGTWRRLRLLAADMAGRHRGLEQAP